MYVNKYLTNNSKKNSLELDDLIIDDILNDYLIGAFQIYKKIFNQTKTKIHLQKNIMNTQYKKILLDFYNGLIDNIDSDYDFYNDLTKVEYVFEIYIDGLEMFKFYVFDNDIDYVSKILHLFNVFTNYIFSEPSKKENLLKRLIRSSNPTKINSDNIDRYLFNIYIFPNNIKRKLAGQSYIPKHLNIYKKTNTAFTTSGVTSVDMILTKKEELSKLLLHELIHLYKLDGNHHYETSFLEQIKQKMPFSDNNSERESVAELMSNIYNCMNLCLIISKDHNLNEDQENNLLNILINMEKEYSVAVVSKILKYFNVQPNELFDYNKNKVELVSPINLYYIFRSVLYFRLNDFLQSKNLVKKNILEINENIYSDLEQYAFESKKSIFMEKLYYYYKKSDLKSNPSVSYITLDIDFDKVRFDIEFKSYDNQNIFLDKFLKDVQQLNYYNKKNDEYIIIGGNINYYYKYLKYKIKYLRLFNN